MRTFKWVVQFEVTESWVEDGFNLTEEEARNMIGKHEIQYPRSIFEVLKNCLRED